MSNFYFNCLRKWLNDFLQTNNKFSGWKQKVNLKLNTVLIYLKNENKKNLNGQLYFHKRDDFRLLVRM